MAGSLVYKMQCPNCDKILRVQSAEAGEQVICRACGSRVQAPAASLLGSLVADDESIPILETIDPTTATASTAVLASSDAPALANILPSQEEPVQLPSTGVPLTEQADGDLDVIPWEVAAEVPALPPPPARPGVPLVLRPTTFDGPDPDETLVPITLDRTPASVGGVAAPLSVAAESVLPVASIVAPVPTAPKAVLVSIAPPFFSIQPQTAAPSAEDLRVLYAARAAGEIHVVERSRVAHPIWWTMLGMLTASVATLLVLLGTRQLDWFSPWDELSRPEISRLKIEAESLAGKGQFKESHERYRQIEEIVAGREARDPDALAMIEASRTDSKRVYAIVLTRAAESARTADTSREPSGSSAAQSRPAVSSVATTAPAMTSSGETPRPPPVVRPLVDPMTRPRGAGARGVRPAPRAEPARAGLTDAQIGRSIQEGVGYLLNQFNKKSGILNGRDRGDNAYFAGMDALAVYALLQAGQAIDDPRLNPRQEQMKLLLDAMKELPIDGYHQTYARGLRSTCLALYDRPADFKTLSGDVDYLLGITDGGAFGYDGKFKPITQRGAFPSRNDSWDNSNSQYGLLGVWSGIEADPRIEVPTAFWKAVEKHWTSCQGTSGQWGYHHQDSGRLTMTCAGIASLFVAHEYSEPPMTTGTVGREPFPPALKKGLDWFERGDNSVRVRDGNWWGYAMYGIERVGLASGFKQFGTHDWYRELAGQAVQRQLQNGSWGDGVVDTSYALLFLARGRHPILMNKLRFDGYWANRPRDAANLARFASRQLEKPINWQCVNVNNPWTDWTDSPILYIASHQPPNLSDAHLEKLKSFVEAGGMIFTHADGGAPAFDKWARDLANKLFPKYELSALPDTHPLWSSLYKIQQRPPMFAVSNGSRLLFLHSPTDLALKWQQRIDRGYESKPVEGKIVINPDLRNVQLTPFQIGINLFVYAAGKRDLRNRLDSAWVEASQSQPIDTIRVARLVHTNNWDPEPGAWVRYANWFRQTTGTQLDVQAVKMSELQADSAATWPVAHLTGTAKVGFSQTEISGLRAYVSGGGVVIVDSTGGMNAFDTEVRENLLPKAFPNDFPRLLDPSHPLFNAVAPGMEDASRPRVRGYTLEKMGTGVGTFQMLTPAKDGKRIAGGGCILLATLDLTSGLLGTNTWGILGFDPKYAQTVVKNAIFWAVDGMAE